MIEWINTKDEPVPKDKHLYLGLWKGAFCLVCWDDGYWIALDPSQFETGKNPLDDEAALNLHYWARLNYPKEWRSSL